MRADDEVGVKVNEAVQSSLSRSDSSEERQEVGPANMYLKRQRSVFRVSATKH